ncbi:uncharacterized protein BO80DRAFT_356017 [Aspergillus ibericus CBS 121593]|uniref:BTB domain-containing protein n=1 Tax=Aspergillus ibericus CBS 121593 TaxID=1448316 RepID=A0A395GYS2_9EURO|nr:hypothetical protein BO80DRAFT_356017 [Aspergillus ibericus CBS 121593]RAL00741.1 hypothetical protein BO80DRAFT_356017 [Aspergillus ibericus CBS 121593]
MAEQSVEEAVEEAVEAEGLLIPELSEYSQAPESPYLTPAITLKVSDRYYTIPQYYLRSFKQLKCSPHALVQSQFLNPKPYHLELAINPQSAHTFVHYLYTGEFETLESSFEPPRTADDIPEVLSTRDSIEFERAAHTYAAAVRYQIPGLQDMAQGFMVRFAERLTMEDILSVARNIYPRLSEEESGRTWLEGFVRRRLEIAYNNRNGKLRWMMTAYGIGNDEKFDRFVIDEVLALYEKELEEVSAALEEAKDAMEDWKRMKLTLDPAPEPLLECASEHEPEKGPGLESSSDSGLVNTADSIHES